MGQNWQQKIHKRTSKKGKTFLAGRKKKFDQKKTAARAQAQKQAAAAKQQAREEAAQAKKEGAEEFRKSDVEVSYMGASVRKRPTK